MRSDAQHYDVASYALGVLDGRDAAAFEDHLVGCDQCAAELEGFLPVAALLADVDGTAFLAAEARVADERMLDEMAETVAQERGKARTRRVFSLAAGVVALAAAAGIGLYAGNVGGGGGTPVPQAQPSASTRAGEEPAFLGGVAAQQATDPVTKIDASVRLAERQWGTAIALDLRNVRGPLKCQLVAVGPDGFGEVIGTWTVSPEGYGTLAHPAPLRLAGSTALKRDEIDRMEVQSINEGARPGRLVSVDV